MSVADWQFTHADRYGEQIGVIYRKKPWTNAALHNFACRFASALIDSGVKPDERVVVALGNCPELVVACAGVTSAGATLVMLGERYSEELRAKVRHCQPRIVICNAHVAEGLAGELPPERLWVAEDANLSLTSGFGARIHAYDPIPEYVKVMESTLAQLCYTSGSTGHPKAVPYTHGALNRFLQSFADSIPNRDGRSNVLVAVPPTAFAGRLWTLRVLWNSLYVVQPQFEPEQTLLLVQNYQIEQMSLLPTMAEQMVACGERLHFDCTSLRSINIGGSHVPAALVDRLKHLVNANRGSRNAVQVSVQYGMTEAGGGIATTTAGGDGIVGRPFPGVTVKIVGRDGGVAGAGEIGEIAACTPFAPQEYWRDPIQTGEVFRDGFVHTGDLGYFRKDGELCLMGRRKDIIIQGGVNIYPSEITNVVSEMPGVAQCVVVGCPNDILGEEVVLCVVRKPGLLPSEQQIRAQCRLSLDPGKQPVRIRFLSALPSSDVGKVDRNALQKALNADDSGCDCTTREAVNTSGEARGILEEQLRVILSDDAPNGNWSVVLNPLVPFGELGLTSLGAVRLVYMLEEKLGLKIPLGITYSYPTIDACAEWLASGLAGPKTEARPIEYSDGPTQDSVSIVGIAVRLAGGVKTPEQFWDLLWNERETVVDAPAGRFAHAGRRASFVEGIGEFDASFFRIANQNEIDPRHRLLLELCWEALENAGIDPVALDGAKTGLFLGLSGEWFSSGNSLGRSIGMAAGYISHFFDIRGPAITVDTTCSSSLVALHQAVACLRQGECDAAIVGSANCIYDTASDPLGVMSADGVTRSFAADAGGFGQGEGGLVIVLRRTQEARNNRDRSYACVLGSAVNHDGRSRSLTAPNPESQSRLVVSAWKAARVRAVDIQYVEAHGTGTPLGDPIEIEGLTTSLDGVLRLPLAVGSVKSNIGHLEAAAGLAGVVKVALALWHRQLPASRHCSQLNSRIPWDKVAVRIASQRGDWPSPDKRLIAGVSAFGMSGTNAHAILAQSLPIPVALDRDPEPEDRVVSKRQWILPVSARTEHTLRISIGRWIDLLERDNLMTLRDIAYSASCRRAHLTARAAVVGPSRQEWISQLREILSDSKDVCGGKIRDRRNIAFIFSGQGAQWDGMAKELFLSEPTFRESFLNCAKHIEAHAGLKLTDELFSKNDKSRLDDTEVTQPALFAVQVALAELWNWLGVSPSAALGHSAGEIAAATVAGLLTLEEAVPMICERGRICAGAPGGGMLAVSTTLNEARDVCSAIGSLEVAAINSPRSMVLTGSLESIGRGLRLCQSRGIRTTILPGGHAFHSSMMRSAADEIATRIHTPRARNPKHLLFSCVTAAPIEHVTAEYLGRQLTSPVQFGDAIVALLARGYNTFIEIGPHPVLLPAVNEVFAQEERYSDAFAVPSISRSSGGMRSMLRSLSKLYCSGVYVDWKRQYPTGGRFMNVPGNIWERRTGRNVSHGHVAYDTTATDSMPPRPNESKPAPVMCAALVREMVAALTECRVDELSEELSLDALGIDSLGLIRLAAELNRGLKGRKIAPRPESTLRELLDCVSGSNSDALESLSPSTNEARLIWLKSEGELPVHIWIHPAGGGVDCYRPLAEAMPFRSAAIDARNWCPRSGRETIEELAAEYLQQCELENIQGRVVLGGWSFGGVVAFEMAVQLTNQSREVERVILIDSFAGGMFKQRGNDLAAAGRGQRLALPDSEIQTLAELQNHHMALLYSHSPHGYSGDVVSLRAVPTHGHPDTIWRKAAPALRVHRVKAGHFSIISAIQSEPVISQLLGTSELQRSNFDL